MQKKLIAHLHWIWPALGLDGLDMKDSDLKNHVLGSDGDSQIVLSCLTSCLQFWLRFLATWNIPEGLEKYDKWYIILSHSRCSYMFLSFLAIETCGHRLLTHTYMRTTTPWWNRYLMMFAESSVDLGQLCQHSTDPGGQHSTDPGGTCSIQYTGM